MNESATITITDFMFIGDIKYKDGDISGIVTNKISDIHKFFYEHGISEWTEIKGGVKC